MPLLVNLINLQTESQDLSGKLPIAELDLGGDDTVVHLIQPREYELTVTSLDVALLVQGVFELVGRRIGPHAWSGRGGLR